MTWQPCAVCGRSSGLVSSDAPYPELCGECAQLVLYRPQDFERKVAGMIHERKARERAKAWFEKQPDGMAREMWQRLDAAELQRECAECNRMARMRA